MQPTQAVHNPSGGIWLLIFGMLVMCVPVTQAQQGRAVVTGVVRNAQGAGQMGALVQVLGADSLTVGTAFTDLKGRYVIAGLNPGRYLVRASATLFVPATRNNLQLQVGASAVVNLTLAALFDTASWLPATRRRADEPNDDWKWTLRSTASRPILRIVEDGEVFEVSSSASEHQHGNAPTMARATVASGDGSFGGGGIHNILALHRETGDGGDMMMRADVAATRVPAAYGPSAEFDAGYERKVGYGGAQRAVVRYSSHPEMAATGLTSGLTVFEMTSAQRMAIGDQVEVEAGGKVQGIHTSATAFTAKPFVRLTGHLNGTWTLQYRMSEDRGVQGFEDVTSGETDVPVALVENGKLAIEKGRHQEASVERKLGRGAVTLVYYHDKMARTSLAGGGASGPGETKAGDVPQGMLVDPTTGSFRALGGGYRTDGLRVTAGTQLTQTLWLAAEYSSGDAIMSQTGGDANFQQSLAGLEAQRSQAMTIALKGRLVAAGTRVRASYRWQQAGLLTAVDPYSAFADQAYFSCQIRQPIRLGSHLPQGLEATIDVTNLLAEGYRPFVSDDGQTLYFAQAPRTIQAGLSFKF